MYKKYLKLILKVIILALFFNLEKVIGLPVFSLTLALFWANKLAYWDKLLWAFVLSIILATAYQFSFAIAFLLLGLIYLIFIVLEFKVKNYSWRLIISCWLVALFLLINHAFASWWGLAIQLILTAMVVVWGKHLPFLYHQDGFRSDELGF